MTFLDMTTWQKTGQLLMGQVFGTQLTAEFEQYIRDYPLGAYRICQYNIVSHEQVRSLIEQINDVFNSMRLPRPIIATDEEGGTLCVFRGIIEDFPGTMALGAAQDETLAYRQAQHIAYEMRRMGLSMNFVPVCDANLAPENTVVGVRSFSDNAALCARMSLAVARGTNAGGLLHCAKHFPGHGGAAGDTHFGWATDERGAEEIERLETAGFLACINDRADAVFADHVVYPAVDAEMPASLSSIWLKDILRGRLGFQGVILSDDLTMQAIARHFGAENAPLMHLLAGGDMAMLCADIKTVSSAFERVYTAIETGMFGREKLEDSVVRICTMKRRAADLAECAKPAVLSGKAIAETICRASATLISGEDHLPLQTGKRILVLRPKTVNLTESDTSQQIQIHLVGFLSSICSAVDEIEYPLDVSAQERGSLTVRAEGYDYVIQLTVGALRYPAQVELFCSLPREKACVLLIREPYDALLLPDDALAICTYSGIDAAMRHVVEILFGRAKCRGVCPVRLEKEAKV